MAWFLVVKDGYAEAGVGRCSFKPGILDLPTGGYMYVVPDAYIRQGVGKLRNPEHASPRKIRELILSYFG